MLSHRQIIILLFQPPLQMNGLRTSDNEQFEVQGKSITPSEVSNTNAEWASSDAFSSAFDAFSNNKLENVSIYILRISKKKSSNLKS